MKVYTKIYLDSLSKKARFKLFTNQKKTFVTVYFGDTLEELQDNVESDIYMIVKACVNDTDVSAIYSHYEYIAFREFFVKKYYTTRNNLELLSHIGEDAYGFQELKQVRDKSKYDNMPQSRLVNFNFRNGKSNFIIETDDCGCCAYKYCVLASDVVLDKEIELCDIIKR